MSSSSALAEVFLVFGAGLLSVVMRRASWRLGLVDGSMKKGFCWDFFCFASAAAVVGVILAMDENGRMGWPSGGILAFYIAILAALSIVDLEEKVIPRKIWLWGFVLAVGCAFLFPGLFFQTDSWRGLEQSLLGSLVGAGVIFSMVELGKVLFGKLSLSWEKPQPYSIVNSEGVWLLNDGDSNIPLEQLFMRKSDTIVIEESDGKKILLWEHAMDIGNGKEPISSLSGAAVKMTIPREAMGFGDVKFMVMAGAMTGWEGALFSIFAGSVIGTLVGGALKVLKGHSEIPFIPFLATGVVGFFVFPSEIREMLRFVFGL
jgi:leader peptidase (prepilin peptidase)/N-methyltransferase